MNYKHKYKMNPLYRYTIRSLRSIRQQGVASHCDSSQYETLLLYEAHHADTPHTFRSYALAQCLDVFSQRPVVVPEPTKVVFPLGAFCLDGDSGHKTCEP